jgi:hypothetical protein
MRMETIKLDQNKATQGQHDSTISYCTTLVPHELLNMPITTTKPPIINTDGPRI